MRSRRRIPVTSDMVSLWIPFGTNRVIDIIRGNDGQCHGTHPNVSAIVGSLNPSVGWVFDGVDDYINVPDNDSVNFGTDDFSILAWIKFPLSGNNVNEPIISKGFTSAAPANSWAIIRPGSVTDSLRYYDATNVGGAWNTTLNSGALSDGWHHVCITRNGTAYRFDVDASEVDSATKTAVNLTNTSDLMLGTNVSISDFIGTSIVLPLIVKGAWSVAQISNFYQLTKGLFSPRG